MTFYIAHGTKEEECRSVTAYGRSHCRRKLNVDCHDYLRKSNADYRSIQFISYNQLCIIPLHILIPAHFGGILFCLLIL